VSSLAEVRQKIAEQGGPKLVNTEFTEALLIHRETGYYQELIGPFNLDDTQDIRVFISHRMLEGKETAILLFQDATDDVFLNHNAEGLEPYTGDNPGGIYYIN